jgi:hypothetical protein
MFLDTGPNDAASEMSHDLEFIGALLDARYPMSDGERIDLTDGLSAAPLFVLGRTRLGCVWRFRTDVPVELVRGVAKLAGREPGLTDSPLTAPPPERMAPILNLLSACGAGSDAIRELVLQDSAAGQSHAALSWKHETEEAALAATLLGEPTMSCVTADWKLCRGLRRDDQWSARFDPVGDLFRVE